MSKAAKHPKSPPRADGGKSHHRGHHRSHHGKAPPPANAATKKAHVDIVTGKELVSVYFDPAKVLQLDPARDADWIGQNFFAPAAVIKDDSGVLTVRLPGGEVIKLSGATRITKNDDEGVDDILKLRDFSEMSLIHTLRVRYMNNEIYTNVGPILISLNPYQVIAGLYSDAAIETYHHKKKVSNELNPVSIAYLCFQLLAILHIFVLR
ncbi:hypothetical protein EON64_04785 [archaeon]|nr:MAG: hypothetical protein EON64_04785 [archaeon]